MLKVSSLLAPVALKSVKIEIRCRLPIGSSGNSQASLNAVEISVNLYGMCSLLYIGIKNS